jgi:hypothetical protein
MVIVAKSHYTHNRTVLTRWVNTADYEDASRQSGGTPGSARLYGLDRRGADHTTVRAGF